jgi:hypothetical protein
VKLLRDTLDRVAPLFEKGGKLETLFPAFEALDTLLYSPGQVTRTASHVRDGLDTKRMMGTVVAALLPCIAMAVYNTGLQACRAIAAGAAPLDDFNNAIFQALGFAYDPASLVSCCVLGALYFVPVLAVTFFVGLNLELVNVVLRREEVNEGFFVTGALIPLILPPTIPLWQVALGTAFGVVIGKEVFGGTGMNFLNPALVARAFLFFAYPAQISGDAPWIAADFLDVDSFSGATLLSQAAADAGALARRLPDPHPRGFLADHGRRRAGHPLRVEPAQLGGLREQSHVRRTLPLAHRAGRLGDRYGVHGHRSGLLELHGSRAPGLRIRDRPAHGARPGGEPRLPRGHDAGDPVHEHVRPTHRLLRNPGEHTQEDGPQCSLVRATRCSSPRRSASSAPCSSRRAPCCCASVRSRTSWSTARRRCCSSPG